MKKLRQLPPHDLPLVYKGSGEAISGEVGNGGVKKKVEVAN